MYDVSMYKAQVSDPALKRRNLSLPDGTTTHRMGAGSNLAHATTAELNAVPTRKGQQI